jgi:16S rRNA U1498 N3-methylase RsmE
MQSVGARITPSQQQNYVTNYQVVEKIARFKRLGRFERVIQEACERAGIPLPRKARQPGQLARLVRSWPAAANDPTWSVLRLAPSVELDLHLAEGSLGLEA